ncbi:MAG: NAD-dependent epimerase/dehydratase family protein [Deltaproteobacteria bacterium]|nr:NAD-dependent epimerase/dehydratase family protein [Deltaproteobacteria bacterium]MCL5276775.1 NAD-dependent epimerase/dehydratase family protein [Deltaproteobacteria bacterium]
MKVGITGVTSLLGCRVAGSLVELGHEVHGVARAKRPSIEPLLHKGQFKFFPGDVTKFEDMEHPFRDVDCVLHLAGVSSERKATEEPLGCFKVNVLGTVNVLEMARRAGLRKVIFSSSAAVYKTTDHAREDDPVPKNTYYGFTKWNAENVIRLYRDKFLVSYTILRFSRLYGPFMERNPVFDMANGILRKGRVTLYDSPGSRYDFLYVDDAARALIASLDQRWDDETVNISSGAGTKISELFDIFKQVSGRRDIPLEILKHDDQIDILTNTKAAALGWRPIVGIKDGVAMTYKWFLDGSA